MISMLGLGKRATGNGGGGGGGDLESLNTILNAMTLDINPIEANVTKDESDLISQVDATGTVGAAWTQSNEARKPLWEADGGGGNPSLTLQDANRVIARTNETYNTYFSTTEAFAVAVAEPTVLDGATADLFLGATSRLKIRRFGSTARGEHQDAGGVDQVNGDTLTVNERTIIAVRHLSGNVGISVNGGTWAEAASGDTATPDTAGNFQIGNASGALTGRLFRLAADNAYPGDTEYANIVSLLASVYGVTT